MDLHWHLLGFQGKRRANPTQSLLIERTRLVVMIWSLRSIFYVQVY